MKYFVISDIHSHYNSMIKALDNNRYDSQNENHHLIVLGDLFDRGDQAKEVLEYIYDLNLRNKATVLLGNHDSFLLDFLEGNYKKVLFNIKLNGFGKTLEQLSNIKPNESNFNEINNSIDKRFPFLQKWLSELPYFFELGDYVFVHGGIDGSKANWKQVSSRADFIWSKEIELPVLAKKTIVAGHHRVATIRVKTKDYKLLFMNNPKAFDILYAEGKILIDRFVEVSNEINVLVLEI